MPCNYHRWVVIDAALNQLEIVYHELDTIVGSLTEMEPLHFSSRHLLSKTSIAWNCSGGSRGEGGEFGGLQPPPPPPKGLRPIDRRVALPREVSNGVSPAELSERASVHVTRDIWANLKTRA